jgi:hypothetical protein
MNHDVIDLSQKDTPWPEILVPVSALGSALLDLRA